MASILLSLMLLFSVPTKTPPDFMDWVIAKQHIRANDRILLFVGQVGDCQKCITKFRENLACLKLSAKRKTIHAFAVVNCEREKEVPLFTQGTDWTLPAYPDRGKLAALGIPNSSRLAILSGKGRVLHIFSQDAFLGASCKDFLRVVEGRGNR